jgi:predicted dehydrogenase
MKRRNFLNRLSLGLGASMALSSSDLFSDTPSENGLFLPSHLNKQQNKKLGIALVGLGYYSTSELAPALQKTQKCYLAGIVSGTPEKAQKWKEQYNIPEKNIYNYQNFDSIKDNPDIDIVYVVLPNAMHSEYTIRAAKAGKHVICEKPMEVNAEKCKEMIKACKENKRLLAIGYRLHYDPTTEVMKQVGKGAYGKIKSIKSENGFVLNFKNWRLNKELAGGGPLMDMGIYCVQGVMYTLGKEPVAVTAKFGQISDKAKFNSVEESISWTMEFADGLKAECNTTYSDNVGYIRAEGDKGWIELKPSFAYRGVKGTSSKGDITFPEVSQQALHMDDFADCVINNKKTKVPGEMGLRDVKILNAIYEAAETGKKVKIV